MENLSALQTVIVWIIPVLFAITLHEVAHGWAALKRGDRTAMMLGRLSLNPIKHIDPIGTIAVPVLLYISTGFVFGWARPVPVTWENLKNPRGDMALVALAGPMANLLMALFWALMMKFSLVMGDSLPQLAKPLLYMGSVGIWINLLLMVLNLLPIQPLDGGRIVSGLLPPKLSWQFDRVERFGLIILLLLTVSGLLWKIIMPVIGLIQTLIYQMFGL